MTSTGVSASDSLPGPDGSKPEGDNASTGRLGDRIFGGTATFAGLSVIAIVVLIGAFLVVQALPALTSNNANFLTSRDWQTSDPMRFGVLELLWTTVSTSLVALIIAVPFSVAIALFLTQYAPAWLARPAAALVDLLAAVPSIVYGLWGSIIVAPKIVPLQNFLQDYLGWLPIFKPVAGISNGATIFFVGIVLAIMILPIITALSREVFAQTPAAHKDAATALGATKWEMIRTAVLPFGKPGVISAAMLGLGRALGETIAVLYIISTLPGGTAWTWSLFNGGSTFASKIAADAAELTPGKSTGAYIAAGLVLFVLTFIVNAIARVIIERRKAFTE
ncbi:phosphate ABC transporter permease subunit PstC [Calidifontibacter sp. DB0510]|uniref:Phosphate transport system permease protein n=1 Tax=Metallococcus carri TaxID=1656884 RepID=A0A967B122_9MICO|nr:phosphate ABC transporter permease subunit PstC [Metallococcus carri]NHN55498.1 phosphate ABC transporter permease subunit PstC [Metallococcus carri]NOP38318.1 phosphate ABC transporter permease subunit PstC [Calidifontibacter sp. DB2511S]